MAPTAIKQGLLTASFGDFWERSARPESILTAEKIHHAMGKYQKCIELVCLSSKKNVSLQKGDELRQVFYSQFFFLQDF